MRRSRPKLSLTYIIVVAVILCVAAFLVTWITTAPKTTCPAGQTWVQTGTINGVPEWGCV